MRNYLYDVSFDQYFASKAHSAPMQIAYTALQGAWIVRYYILYIMVTGEVGQYKPYKYFSTHFWVNSQPSVIRFYYYLILFALKHYKQLLAAKS